MTQNVESKKITILYVVRKCNAVMSCMRVCRKQALSRVKYYYYATISKIQQATIMTV